MPEGALIRSSTTLRIDAAHKRQLILDAARKLLASEEQALPPNVLARHAGVGVGTVYRHFPSRQALIEGLASDALGALVEEARAATTQRDPSIGLSQLLSSAVHLALSDRAVAEVLGSSEPVCVDTLGLSADLLTNVDVLLRRCRGTGVINRAISGADIRRLVAGVATAATAGPDPLDSADRYLGFVLAGIRA